LDDASDCQRIAEAAFEFAGSNQVGTMPAGANPFVAKVQVRPWLFSVAAHLAINYKQQRAADQLAELEMHLAAGTDLPTALAAMDDRPRTLWRCDPAFQAGMVIGMIVSVVVVLWRCA
jgi:hypothetical protein